MEHSMQFADHPLITVIAPIFQLSATMMKKSTRTSRIYFVVRSTGVGVVADHLISATPAVLAFLVLKWPHVLAC